MTPSSLGRSYAREEIRHRAAGHQNDRAPRVEVPPAMVAPLLRFLVRALAREIRENGGSIPVGMADFLHALQSGAELPVAVDGHPQDCPDMIEGMGRVAYATVAQLAELSGFSPRTLRRWAAAGRVRAMRAGRTWLIDPESLTS